MLTEPQFLAHKRKLHEQSTLNHQNEAFKLQAPAHLEANARLLMLRNFKLKAYPRLCQSFSTRPKTKNEKQKMVSIRGRKQPLEI